MAKKKKRKKHRGTMKWWHLSLIGVGCTIGTGYFLGSAIGIKQTGPSIVLAFILSAIGTYIVFHLLAKMTADDPQNGSFCYYAKKAYGDWAGFSCGWNYWCCTILIMGSQLTALSTLSRFWFPNVPLWIFALCYAILAIAVVLLGTNGFNKAENFFAVIQLAAIVMFIIIALCAVFGAIKGAGPNPNLAMEMSKIFVKGFRGFWASLIYAFYAYGGIEVIGLMAMQLKKKEDTPKSGTVMLIVLTIIYVASLILAVSLVGYGAFTEEESPFVTALKDYKLALFTHIFNACIIIGGFSTMTASLFAVTHLLVTMSDNGDAPVAFAKKMKKMKNLPLASLGLATAGLILSIVTALLLPDKIYEYITTAAGILLLYNWGFIILSSFKLLTEKTLDKILGSIGLLLLAAAVTGTLAEKEIMPGFFTSLALVAIIAIVTVKVTKKRKKAGST